MFAYLHNIHNLNGFNQASLFYGNCFGGYHTVNIKFIDSPPQNRVTCWYCSVSLFLLLLLLQSILSGRISEKLLQHFHLPVSEWLLYNVDVQFVCFCCCTSAIIHNWILAPDWLKFRSCQILFKPSVYVF